MCSTLKFQKYTSKIGHPVHVVGSKGQGIVTWSGFVKKNRLDFWQRKGETKKVNVKAHTFVEGKVEFKVPGGLVQAVGLKKDVLVNGSLVGPRNTVKLVTRAAMNEFEKGIHKRWPLVKVDGQVHEFSENDVVNGQVQGKLL